MLKFASWSTQERTALLVVLERAEQMGLLPPTTDARLGMVMGLSATHATCPLDVERLAAFRDVDFAHDLAGIQRHLNRETGELEDCFLPRCAREDA